MISDLASDLRYGARSLIKSPAFTTVTLLSLALGIGANTAIFQLLDAVHLRTLPVADPGKLVEIKIDDKGFRSGGFYSWHSEITHPQWLKIKERQEGFSSVMASGEAELNISPSGEARWARGMLVSGSFFQTLGVPPFLGRVFTEADDTRGCGPGGVVVSHAFWERELGGDPAAVGRKISLDGHDFEVVGVTPASFYGFEMGRSFDVAAPVCVEDALRGEQSRLEVRHDYFLTVIGRLKPGWTRERAAAQLVAISKGVFEDTVPERYPPQMVERYKAYQLEATPAAHGISQMREDYSRPLYLLLATAGLVLLIACANLANLLLARAGAREKELAVRLALGASRGRMIRQLMTESLLLALLGAALGLWVARTLSGLLVRFLSTRGNDMFVELAPDWRVLAFTVGVAALTCLLFGLAPALRASRTDLGVVLKATSGRGATIARFGLRRMLVAVQVALSFVLLVGALLFSRSLSRLSSVETGFDDRGVSVVNLDFRKLNVAKEQIAETQLRLIERVRGAPAVAAAASTSIVPISGSAWNQRVSIDGVESEGKDGLNTFFTRVSPGYFDAIGAKLLAGRDLGAGDTLGAPVVGVVNQTFARRMFGDESPIGKRVRVGSSSNGQSWTIDVVGLVADTKYRELKEDYRPLIHVALAQDKDPSPDLGLLVRRRGNLPEMVASLKRAVSEVSPLITLDVDSLERLLRDSLLRERLLATLSGFFGLLATLLATVGLYGVVAYGVARRTREIGIRVALGARGRTIAGMILRETSGLLVIGLGAGVLLALAAMRLASSMLYGLQAHDPMTFAMAVLLISGVTLAAAAIPARRASRILPMVALKEE